MSTTFWWDQNSCMTGVRKIVVGSNLVVILVFATRIAEELVVNITSSKAKESYS